MNPNLEQLPELPSEDHPFFLLPERTFFWPDSSSKELRFRESGSGRPILLLHGLWSSSFTFRNLISSLSKHHHVVLPELLEPSRQSFLAGQNVQPQVLSQWIGTIIENLSLKDVCLVGHAELGLAGLLFALEEQTLVSSVVVIGSPLRVSWKERIAGRLLGPSWPKNLWARAGFHHPLWMARKQLRYRDKTVLSRQELRQLAKPWSMLPDARARVQILAQTLSSLYLKNTISKLQNHASTGKPFPSRLTLIYGDSDSRVPLENGQKLNQWFPGSELLVAEGSSCDVQVEKPEWTARGILSAAKNQ
jgi:pimeloyl-ACP methyl ester carboxylesterase